MPTFAYAQATLTLPVDASVLNSYGTNGWDLIAVVPVPLQGDKVQLIFKKQLPPGTVVGALSVG